MRVGQLYSVLLLSGQFLLLVLGGWLAARHAFRLPSNQRLPVGMSLGLVLFIFFSNLFGRWIAPNWSFWVSAMGVLFIGGLAWLINKGKLLDKEDLQVWPQLLVLGALILLFTQMGRGLAIFDDRKNLSLISLMAAGDIPPHFYMNSEFLFSYHYGFQLLGASLMRNGGLLPWSAFDLSKGIVGGLAILMGFVWARKTSRSTWGGIAFAFILLFASGARWILLLFPPSVVHEASHALTLWGSGAQTAPSLVQGLSSSWVVEGGPPSPIPFAYINGILQPLVLHLQAGPRAFALVIFFTLLMLVGNRRNILSSILVIFLLASWALAAEAEFALFAFGMGILALLLPILGVDQPKRDKLRNLFLITFVAGLISLIQGGTITEIARALVSRASGSLELGSIGPDVGFGLRIPPAIVSAHLGEMRIFNPGELAIGLAEIGPLLFLAPIALRITRRRIHQGDYFSGVFGASTIVGFVLPLFFSYSVDRDVTRMTQYAMVGWLILSWPVLTRAWKSGWLRWRSLIAFFVVLVVLGGLAVTSPLLSAMDQVVLTDGIEPVDAVILHHNWDQLQRGSEILDSHPWRIVVLTGRLTRSSSSGYSTLPEWDSLTSEPSLAKVLAAGFDYIYIDTYWWESMTLEEQSSFSSACVKLVDQAFDNAANGQRWLLDLRECDHPGSSGNVPSRWKQQYQGS